MEEQEANLNTSTENIVTSRNITQELTVSWASGCDVGGYSVRLFVSTLQRLSHVPACVWRRTGVAAAKLRLHDPRGP